VDTERADRVFAELGLACPPIDASMLASYLEALVAGGHLRAPGGASAAALPEGGPGDGEEPPTVLALWESAVRAWPRRAAATDAHETASFAELDRRSQLIAAGLAALGVSRGDRVGVRLSHDVSLLATVLAVVRVGAAFVPVDFRHNDQRSRGIMHQAGVTVTVAHDDFDGPGELDGSVTSPAALLEIGRGATAPPPGGGPVAYVMFTSGSSGPPKGVVVPHRALARYLDWVRTEYCGGDGLGAPLYSSLAFDLTITSLFGPLVSGGTVHLVDPHKGILRVAEMLCDGARFDFVKATPTHLRILVDELRGRSLRGHVSALVLGGEALPADLVEQWRELSPDTVVYNEYGPTEATVGCCVYRLEPSTPVPHPVPIGWPVPGVRLRVLDAHGRECVPGHLGELAIGGPSLAWGYDADARQTSARFVPDQNGWAPGDRSYLSGDLVHQEDDGSFYYHGRADHQLKVRGHRVEAGEVEAALRSLDDVGEALVRLRGRQEDAVLVAYVRTTSSEELDGRRVRAQLRGLLPGYMIPTDVVVVGEFPTTLNGKIDVAALPVPPGPAASIDGAAG
jgi:amino acid adenylation domain-containing protein